MKKSKQLELIPLKTNRRFFGGALLHGRRKAKRPLITKDATHLVLRSVYAKGKTSFRNPVFLSQIESTLERSSRKYGVKIYRKAIQSNHIHLIIKIHSRRLYRCFIAVITGRIASVVMRHQSFKKFIDNLDGGEGRKAPYRGQSFWEYRPFSRILHWGKDYTRCCGYLRRNILEALGFLKYRPRQDTAYAKYLIKIQPDEEAIHIAGGFF